MSFLSPLALAFLLLAGPIVLLYMLKLRRQQVRVSSSMLWSMLIRDREANSPWQKLRRNLLLVLQLIVLGALAFALARPFVPVPTVASGVVAVLLDASASMNATDVAPSRFEAARAAARQIVDGLSDGGRMTLIRVAGEPEVLASSETDQAALRRAIDSARPSDGPADWDAAFALAAGAVGPESANGATVVVISDGGLPSTGLPPLPTEVRFVPIGGGSNNLAISALSLRPAASGPQLFASVSNYDEGDRSVIVSFYANDLLLNAQEITVPGRQSSNIVLNDLPEGATVYRATLAAPPQAAGGVDSLPTDDTAFAVYQPPTSGRTLLVSPGNLFLEQLLAALPGLQPFRAPADVALPTDPFDLYVFDGTLPAQLPEQDLLLINPPSNELFPVEGEFGDTANAQVSENPLTQSVDWRGVHVLKARKVTPPDWAQVLVDSPGGPLVFAGEVAGRRVAVLTFDLHDSDLPLQVAYPILMANLINFLSPAQEFSAPDGLRPGDTLEVHPEAEVDSLLIGYPDGTFQTFQPGETGLVFTDTRQLGLYAVNDLAGSDVRATRYFAVNLFDPRESDIRPNDSITVGRANVTAAARQELGQQEFWPWLAALALLVLLVEWWVYHRGSSLPAQPGWRGWLSRPSGRGGRAS